MRLNEKDVLLSIVIPCYNVEKYIVECLESICRSQTEDIEVICVDDGSTDGTLSVIEQWKQRDSRIIVVKQENKGVSAARNRGMHIAKGKFIYFLDSDDKVNDLAILLQCCEKMQEDNLDMLVGAARSFYESPQMQERFPEFEKRYQIKGEYPRVIKGSNLMAELRRNGEWFVPPGTRIYRRKFLQDNHVCYTEGLIHEDNYVAFWCMYLAERATAVKDVLYERRVREDSIMTQEVTHKNTIAYLANFIQDIYLIAEYREQETPRLEIDFPLEIARREIKRTYCLLDEKERKIFEECLTEEQKFYFDTLVRKEIELTNRLDRKNELLERMTRENKEAQQNQQNQQNQILKLEKQIAKLEEDNKQEKEKSKKLQEKIKISNKKIKELKNSNSWKIGRVITWPIRKLKKCLKYRRQAQ